MYEYPDTEDPNFQSKIYKKGEYYLYKIPYKDHEFTKEEITEYRDEKCGKELQLSSHQKLLANFINPYTPYRGLLLIHGTGSGKTCAAISIAEQFKEQVEKYHTKIYIITKGPILKEEFKNELINCTGYTYLKDKEALKFLNQENKKRIVKSAIKNAMRYYTIISYDNFRKRVLGDIIADTTYKDGKQIKKKRKDISGDFEREQSINKIEALHNSLVIVDEAHNLTDNDYSKALRKVIKASKNLKIVLLSATPMKNLPSDIIDLLNILRPMNDPIKKDKVFTGEGYNQTFTTGGEEYLKKKAMGYVSFYKGNDRFTFAKMNNIGIIPPELLFTPVVKCYMETFQQNLYNNIIDNLQDSLDKNSGSVSTIVYPLLDVNTKQIIPTYSEQGLNKLIGQLNEYSTQLNKIMKDTFFTKQNMPDMKVIYYNTNTQCITGLFLKNPILKNFSTKFSKCIEDLEQYNDTFEVVESSNYKGSGTSFVYANLVKVGVKQFQEVLNMNGFLEFNEDGNYNLQNDTKHYRYNITYSQYLELVKQKHPIISKEKFYPATYIIITGSADDNTFDIPEEKQNIIRNVFSNIKNQKGRYIKVFLGSKVVMEGVTLENVRSVHIIDVHYHLGRVDQIIGRAIRYCKHYKSITEKNFFPEVDIYRYVIGLKNNTLSKDEELYKKAELKYIGTKKVERLLKIVSIDCPINHATNQDFDDINEFKDCKNINELLRLDTITDRDKKKLCPISCEFENCRFKCYDEALNLQYYDSERSIYKFIDKSHLDYSTFYPKLLTQEINTCKQHIKDLFRINNYYTFSSIKNYVITKYQTPDLFDEFFLYQALNKLMPRFTNEFNNFTDIIYNIYNETGYLTYSKGMYIFTSFTGNEDIPLYYRDQNNRIIENIMDINKINYVNTNQQDVSNGNIEVYDFESNRDYYENRIEFDIVGIIDKSVESYKLKEQWNSFYDVFKLRPALPVDRKKQRGIGISSLKGAMCTTYEKNKLFSILNVLPISISSKQAQNRIGLCNFVRDYLLFMERHGGTPDIADKTYIIIPSNHHIFKHPYNYIKRIAYLQNILQNKILVSTKKISTSPPGSNEIIRESKKYNIYEYTLKISKNSLSQSQIVVIEKYDFTLDSKDTYSLMLNP